MLLHLGMLSSSWRRRLVGPAAVLAALSAIATSPPEWHLEDSVPIAEFTLDTSTPEAVHHFTVRSSQSHSVRVTGTIHWDPDVADPVAAVRLRVTADDGTEVIRSLVRADESVNEDGVRVDGSVAVSGSVSCAEAPCEAGYTVHWDLVDGHPAESVAIDYSFRGEITGNDSHAPDDAFVTVSED